MSDRAKDWLAQAVRDLDQARDSKAAGRHEWACFASHQAAEKAIKSLHLHLGQEAWGHVVAMLLRELPSDADLPSELIDKGHALDAFYVASRYPNGHVAGAPFEHYGPLQSEEAIRYAGEILDLVRGRVAPSR
jgi:HEPN domain-containing protein